MKRRHLYLLIFTACCLLLPYPVSASSVKEGIEEGNRLYNDKKFDEALESYNEAQAEEPDSDLLNFNIGAALFKKGEYQKAIDAFTNALITDDRKIEADANYNIGNSSYRLGKQKEDTEPQAAVDLYRQALDYYKRAMELNQEDKDLKYNHEFVERNMNVLLDKLKQQKQEQGNKGGNKKEGNKKEEDKKEGRQEKANPSEQKRDEGKQQTGEQTEDKKENQETGTQNDDKETAKHKPADEQQDEMSEEEARMLLEQYGQEEKPLEEMMKDKARRGYYPQVLKDW